MSEARRRSPSSRLIPLALGLSFALFSALAALPALAQPTLAVTCNLDSPKLAGSNATCASTAPGNPCTLRAAIETVNAGFDAGAEITFPAGTFVITLDPLLGLLTVTAPMSITGTGANHTVIDGNLQTGVLQVSAGVTATVSSLSILHGKSLTVGGIANSGNLTLNDVRVALNQAPDAAGIATRGTPSRRSPMTSPWNRAPSPATRRPRGEAWPTRRV